MSCKLNTRLEIKAGQWTLSSQNGWTCSDKSLKVAGHFAWSNVLNSMEDIIWSWFILVFPFFLKCFDCCVYNAPDFYLSITECGLNIV